jgi:hypothetical protein
VENMSHILSSLTIAAGPLAAVSTSALTALSSSVEAS